MQLSVEWDLPSFMTFGAKIIEGSDPGIYKGILSHPSLIMIMT